MNIKQNRDLIILKYQIHLQEVFFFFLHFKRKIVLAYTWIGETAAAGAVRTGIPLSGLLGEECI